MQRGMLPGAMAAIAHAASPVARDRWNGGGAPSPLVRATRRQARCCSSVSCATPQRLCALRDGSSSAAATARDTMTPIYEPMLMKSRHTDAKVACRRAAFRHGVAVFDVAFLPLASTSNRVLGVETVCSHVERRPYALSCSYDGADVLHKPLIAMFSNRMRVMLINR